MSQTHQPAAIKKEQPHMSQELRPDYQQQFLFPPSLDELVPWDHPARYVRMYVEEYCRRTGSFQRGAAGKDGRPHYAGDMLLMAWLYGSMRGITSMRDLERMCREDIGFLWLTGMLRPDHNTLWRFHDQHRAELPDLFKDMVRVAAKLQLVGMLVHAVDGTKLVADVAGENGVNRERLKQWLRRLDEAIMVLMRRIDAAEQREADKPECRLPQGLSETVALRTAVQQVLDECERQDSNYLHLSDTDARRMRTFSGHPFSYNAQAVVDEQSGLIVAETVTNEVTDQHQLAPMLEAVKEVLGETAAETLADAGYAMGEQLAKADQAEAGVLVNLGETHAPRAGTKPYHASRFVYDAERDVYVCPQGKDLSFERLREERKYHCAVRVYRCKACRACPVRSQCTKDRHGRMIEQSPYYEAVERQKRKLADPAKRALLKRRGSIVERVFGDIKQKLRLRRLTVRGMEKARGQWTLMCCAYNLRVLYRHYRTILLWWLAVLLGSDRTAPAMAITQHALKKTRYFFITMLAHRNLPRQWSSCEQIHAT